MLHVSPRCIHRLLLFLCPIVPSIIWVTPSSERRLGERSRRKEWKVQRVSAGEEASIRDADSGHERMARSRASSGHDAWFGRGSMRRVGGKSCHVARVGRKASRSLTPELFGALRISIQHFYFHHLCAHTPHSTKRTLKSLGP